VLIAALLPYVPFGLTARLLNPKAGKDAYGRAGIYSAGP
jgi:hypothetical protein